MSGYSEDRQRRLRSVLRGVTFGAGLLAGIGIAALIAGESTGDSQYRGFWLVVSLTTISSVVTAVLAQRAIDRGHPQVRRIVTSNGAVVTVTGLILVPVRGLTIIGLLVLAAGIAVLLLARISDTEAAG